MISDGYRTLFKNAHTKRKLLIGIGIVVALFVIANIGMMIAYRGRALPNYSLGKLAIGGKTLHDLQSVTPSTILPAKLTFVKNDKSVSKSPEELGVQIDVEKSLHAGSGMLRWLPVFSLVGHHYAPLALMVNHDQYGKTAASIQAALSQPPVKQHIDFDGNSFVIRPSKDGYEVDTSKLLSNVTATLQKGDSKTTVETKAVHTTDHMDLSGQLQKLQKQLDTQLSLAYQGRTVQPSKADIGKWFAGSGQTMALSTTRFKSYINSVGTQLGITVANQDNLAAASAYALGKNTSMKFAIVPSNNATVVRTYCTAVRGVAPSVLAELDGKLAATYADVSGWNDNGRIVFQKVDSDCQYTVWMAAASQMASFGSICDDYWNCQVGTNVIMNYDRWVGATPSWNKTGANLENYHVMMINHETGHRLGFLDNYTCPKPDGPAPIMLQQSIDLKGCAFNIWPTPSEFTALNKTL